MTTRVMPCDLSVVLRRHAGSDLTRVMCSVWPCSAEPHRSESMNFAAIGPRMMPTSSAGSASPRYHICLILTDTRP